MRPGRDRDLRRSRPPSGPTGRAFDAGGRGRRASPAGVRRRARAAGKPGGAGGRRPRRATDIAGQAPAQSRRADPARGRGAAARGQGPDHRARSPIGCISHRKPQITTSSTSTARSASPPEPPPRSGRWSTPSSSEGGEREDAPGRNRTYDLALRRRTLYPLSYRREAVSLPPGRSPPIASGRLARVEIASRIFTVEMAEPFVISRGSDTESDIVQIAISHDG